MKKVLVTFALLLALVIPLTAFAATSDAPAAKAIRGFCGVDTSTMTEEQKADMLDSWKKVMEAKRDAVKKMMENKSITKEQGEAMLQRIDDMIKYHQENGFNAGCGNMGAGQGKGRGGMMGRGMGGGCRMNAPAQ